MKSRLDARSGPRATRPCEVDVGQSGSASEHAGGRRCRRRYPVDHSVDLLHGSLEGISARYLASVEAQHTRNPVGGAERSVPTLAHEPGSSPDNTPCPTAAPAGGAPRRRSRPRADGPGARTRLGEPLVIEGGAVAWQDGVISYVGPADGLPDDVRPEVLDGCTIAPGFADCHTHLPFVGWRADEPRPGWPGRATAICMAGGGMLPQRAAARRGVPTMR